MSRWLARLRPWLALALLVATVVALGWLSQRYTVEATTAAAGELELGPASQRLLERFDGPVQLTAFLPPDSDLRDHVSRLLAAYRAAGPDLRFDVVDPKARPELVRELAVTRRGEVVVEYRGQRERAMAPTQARISAALERLLFEDRSYIAFVTGHGERDLLGIANFDLGQFGRQLQRKGYRMQPWRLDGGRPVPDNASLLVVADPKEALTDTERQRLADYLDRGGALLWLTEPDTRPGITGLTELLGVRRQPGVLVDPAATELLAVDDPRMLLVNPDQQHDTVATGEDPLLLAQAAAVTRPGNDEWRSVPLLRAGPRTRLATLPWDEAGGVEDARTAAGESLALGLSRGAEAADGTRAQRVAVVGDGDFLSNSYLGNAGNMAFGLNLVQWLLAEDTVLDTYQPATPDQKLAFTRVSQTVVGLGFLLVLPGLLAAAGALRWWRLRRG